MSLDIRPNSVNDMAVVGVSKNLKDSTSPNHPVQPFAVGAYPKPGGKKVLPPKKNTVQISGSNSNTNLTNKKGSSNLNKRPSPTNLNQNDLTFSTTANHNNFDENMDRIERGNLSSDEADDNHLPTSKLVTTSKLTSVANKKVELKKKQSGNVSVVKKAKSPVKGTKTAKKAHGSGLSNKFISDTDYFASRPSYIDMVCTAIRHLNEKHGSSRAAIAKFIKNNFAPEPRAFNIHLKTALKRAVAEETIQLTKGVGAAGSFRLKSVPEKVSVSILTKKMVGQASVKSKSKKLSKTKTNLNLQKIQESLIEDDRNKINHTMGKGKVGSAEISKAPRISKTDQNSLAKTIKVSAKHASLHKSKSLVNKAKKSVASAELVKKKKKVGQKALSHEKLEAVSSTKLKGKASPQVAKIPKKKFHPDNNGLADFPRGSPPQRSHLKSPTGLKKVGNKKGAVTNYRKSSHPKTIKGTGANKTTPKKLKK